MSLGQRRGVEHEGDVRGAAGLGLYEVLANDSFEW